MSVRVRRSCAAPPRLVAAAAALSMMSQAPAGQSLTYPATRRDATVDTYHGTTVADPYRWLEHLESADTRSWVESQRRVTEAYFARSRTREVVRDRLSALWNYSRTSVPWREAGRLFFTETSGLQRQPVLFVQETAGDVPRALLDPHDISPDASIAVADFSVSPDGRWLAYSRSRGGADTGDTRVRALESGEDLRDSVSGTLGTVCWTFDGGGFFYARQPAPRPGDATGARIEKQHFYHVLGRPQDHDRLIGEWKDIYRWLYCMLSDDGRRAIVVAERGAHSWMYVLDLGNPLAPVVVYRLDLRTGTSAPLRPPRLPFDASRFETRQVFYASKDGTRVPMFITGRKDLRLDGSHAALLTGYGGYGAISSPGYEPDIPLWLELGGIHALANIRGGGEYGEEWHLAGSRQRKQNSFDDFIAAAEYLRDQGYTRPARLAIYGHSNGGLLVGAMITQRPDLFAAAVPNAGHYDMLRYHRFTVGAGWIFEFGTPDSPDDYPYLRGYSPLHNVRAGPCYPATLLLAADHDDRVVPSHAYKFTAALQAVQTCGRPIVLRLARNASHSYASADAAIAERTDMWSFIADQLCVRIRW